jgi:hypothetical protein
MSLLCSVSLMVPGIMEDNGQLFFLMHVLLGA